MRWLKIPAAAAGLVALQALGDALVARTGWPLSGSVLGLLMLLGLLCLWGGVPDSLEAVTAPLLNHLMLLLIPSVAAVSMHGALLTRHAAVFAVVSIVATAVTAGLTAWALARLMRRRGP